jgi:ubiquinone/menaquinone biosynthesis C-methylase UbiE
MDDLEWTGERLVTSVQNETMVEHLQRYYFAQTYCHDKSVLDIASGEGYGTSILARTAKSVIGVDIDSTAVQHASSKYGSDSTEFMVGSATRIPLDNQTVDVVVSFETIEHFDEHQVFMTEVLRVLKPEGLFIVSSPDRKYYSDVKGWNNPHHVRELYEHEFVNLLSSNFKRVTTFHQRFVYGCLLVSGSNATKMLRNTVSFEGCENHVLEPEFILALATNNERQNLDDMGVFTDFSKQFGTYMSNSNHSIRIRSSKLYVLFVIVKNMFKVVKNALRIA